MCLQAANSEDAACSADNFWTYFNPLLPPTSTLPTQTSIVMNKMYSDEEQMYLDVIASLET